MVNYLTAGGEGFRKEWRVWDIVPSAATAPSPVLVLVFESPGRQELDAGLPVVGPTGERALRFLLQQSTTACALGRFIRYRYSLGDARVAVMNVCSVPLQASAFDTDGAPQFTNGRARAGWDLIAASRRHWASRHKDTADAEVAVLSEVVRTEFQRRVENLRLAKAASIVPFGAVARRFAAGMDRVVNAEIQHPSPANGHWTKWVAADNEGAQLVKALFRGATSEE